MIDPLTSLAISIHASPEVYALLLGSGVSRSSGILTGWEIQNDLIRKIAMLKEEDCEPDPFAWFKKRFGRDPEYSGLLDAVAKSPSARQQLLRSYFEPDEDEREQGLKQPTDAHRAIARMVAGGNVRVVLTTNFDKLIERAIEDEGISPTVIHSADTARGALPLVHQQCCVIKLNGDYLDVRIKNTPEELADYDEEIVGLLDQVLDQFGLVVSGWSGEWDAALRAAIERCPSRRFPFVWATIGDLTESAQQLVNLRAGEIIRTTDADSLFGRLSELVAALEESRRPHPTSVEASSALVKRYLSDPRYSSRLYDLVIDETEAAYQKIAEYNDESLQQSQQERDLGRVLRHHREILEILQNLLVHGCALGKTEHEGIWTEVVERMARVPETEDGAVRSGGLWHYPAMVLFYTIGLIAVARQRTELLARLLSAPQGRNLYETKPLLVAFDWIGMHRYVESIKERGTCVPLSEHLSDTLREPVRRYVPDAGQYDECFDRFEYIRALVYMDLEKKVGRQGRGSWAPPGRFCAKDFTGFPSGTQLVKKEVERMGGDWPLLRLGLFEGSLERLLSLARELDEFVKRLGYH